MSFGHQCQILVENVSKKDLAEKGKKQDIIFGHNA